MKFIVVSPDTDGKAKELEDSIGSNKSLIRYHSKRCGHCTAMTDDFHALASSPRLKDKQVIIADVDVDSLGKLSFDSAKAAKGQPVPIIVMVGSDGKDLEEYDGDRSSGDMERFALRHLEGQSGGRRRVKRRTVRRGKSARRNNRRRTRANKRTRTRRAKKYSRKTRHRR